MLYFSRALTGLGASALYLSLIQETIRIFRNSYSLLISLVIMIGYAGGITANAPFALCVDRFGLTPVLYTAGGISVFFYLLYLLTASTLKPPPVRTHSVLQISPTCSESRTTAFCFCSAESTSGFTMFFRR